MVRRIVAFGLMLWPAALAAQTVVTSSAPEGVSVTLYRDPDRGGDEIDRRFPTGFALVTETRTLRLPAGPATLRFEGVAGGILPGSAVVTGLPAWVREKNLDADLLSPRALYDRSLGRRVLVRRTDRATGRVTQEQAIVRSSGEGAAVFQTAAGIETLQCTGIAETLTYPGVPAGLPSRPTLSIDTDAAQPIEATVTLAYLAGGFDWQANHVLTIGDDGRANWSARVTLASSDVTGFPDAGLQLVAGKVNREDGGEGLEVPDGDLRLNCWRTEFIPPPPVAVHAPPPPPPPPPAPMMLERSEDIVVTGMRVKLEQLGDLKLYRAPRPVTVAANAQKQIGLFEREGVPIEIRYRSDVNEQVASNPDLILTTRNRTASGLGLPIPSGPIALFDGRAARPLLIGEASLTDRAVDERVEIELPGGGDVTATNLALGEGNRRKMRLTVTNATPQAIRYEARLAVPDDRVLRRRRNIVREDGRWFWRTTVPANGTATLNWETGPHDPDRVTG